MSYINAIRWHLYQMISIEKLFIFLILIFPMQFLNASHLKSVLVENHIAVNFSIVAFSFQEPLFPMVLLLASLIFGASLPHHYADHPLVYLRTGRKVWASSQLLAILLMSVFLTLLLVLVIILSYYPYISFKNDWGAIIQSLTRNNRATWSLNLPFTSNQALFNTSSPLALTSATTFILFLIFLLSNLLNASLNLIRPLLGIYANGILFLLGALDLLGNLSVRFISPLYWLNPDRFNWGRSNQAPSISYAIGFLLVLNFLLAAFYLYDQVYSRRDPA